MMADEKYQTDSVVKDHDLRTYSIHLLHYSKDWPIGKNPMTRIIYEKPIRASMGNILSESEKERILLKAVEKAQKRTQPLVLTRFDNDSGSPSR